MTARPASRRARGPVIAVDGPAGAGKSTLARGLAARLGLLYVDTGAMYRAIAWRALEDGIAPDDEEAVGALARRVALELASAKDGRCRVRVDGRDVTGELRDPRISRAAPVVARIPAVRERLVALQRELAREGGVVVDGRDIGTAVLPDADLKFFVTASLHERAGRRWRQLHRRGVRVTFDEVREEMRARDRMDETRDVNPLRRAEDSILVDTSHATVSESLAAMLRHCR